MSQNLWIQVVDDTNRTVLWGPGPMPFIPRVGDRINLQSGPLEGRTLWVRGANYELSTSFAIPITQGFAPPKRVPEGVGIILVLVEVGD